MLGLIGGANPILVWREKRGMSLAQVAGLADIPKATLADCEARRATPDGAVLRRLAQALRVAADDLVIRD